MIKKEDFMFTVGYQGDTAIVDDLSKRKYGKLGISDLVKQGMFKPALCAALYSGEESDIETVLNLYNEHATKKISSIDELKRVYGVTKTPAEILKVTII